MARRFRRLFCALLVCSALVASSAPASAYSGRIGQEPDSGPVLFDMLVLRPVGLALTGVGLAAFAVTAPINLVTRPTDMGKPFVSLVVTPARFTFVDKLGYHPDRLDAGFGKIE